MRETRRNRTKKINRKKAILAKYIPVITKSRAGVEYTHFKLSIPALLGGLNHQARRILRARNK